MRRNVFAWLLAGLACAEISSGQAESKPKPSPSPAPAPAPAERLETDEYTRYELLAPDTAQFHILYEVTAVQPGATVFFNPIRKGSEASGEKVFDRMTGEELKMEVVSGTEARRTGLPRADTEMDYIPIKLRRPVPAAGGRGRPWFGKRYRTPRASTREGNT